MKDIAIMYHYVKPAHDWRGIVPLLAHEFEQQIDFLAKRYQIISVTELSEPSQRPRCLLTFDDGTKDQYDIAFTILNKKGLPAYFTFMSAPLAEKKIPVFHLIHTVLSFYSDEEIWGELSALYDTTDIATANNYYAYETNLYRRYNKYMLNFMLSEQEARQFLEKLFNDIFPNTTQFIQDYYINSNEIKAMHKAGMTIGVHCHNHAPYHGDATRFYQEEIAPCKKFLTSEVGIVPEWYTPAFGGGKKLTEMKQDLTPILLKNGFKGACTTVPRSIDPTEPFWFDRFDCNDFPPKKQA